jgi:glutathione reductase (NADPH)
VKLVGAGINELVVGRRVIGMGADETLQVGVDIALKMGATEAEFDSTVAIHLRAAPCTLGACRCRSRW